MSEQHSSPEGQAIAGTAAPNVGDTVHKALEHYFNTLGDQAPHALYDMVIQAAERPLLEVVMARYHGNISHAAKALGLTRNTLRKKLQLHGLGRPSNP